MIIVREKIPGGYRLIRQQPRDTIANMGRIERELEKIQRVKDDEANKRLNLALRGREKAYGATEAEQIPNSTIAGREARTSSMNAGNPCGPGYEWIDAPQSPNKTKHRATKCCYSLDKQMEVMVIIMRDTSMIQYDGVDAVLWDILKNSDSTHDFIEDYLDGVPWSKVTYSQLPRKRPEEFQLGIERQCASIAVSTERAP